MVREYTPIFSPNAEFLQNGVEFKCLNSDIKFQVQVLENDIVRCRLLPSSSSVKLSGLIPQLSTHAISPLSSSDTPHLNVTGIPRDDVSKLFSCPQPFIKTISSNEYVLETDSLCIQISIDANDGDLSLEWISKDKNETFLKDLPHRSYSLYKNTTGGRHFIRVNPNDYYYGLGERASPLNLNGRRFRLESLDAMGYDASKTDPLYKHIPFFITLNTESKSAHGIFYDSLSSGIADFGHEIDAFWGKYHMPLYSYCI